MTDVESECSSEEGFAVEWPCTKSKAWERISSGHHRAETNADPTTADELDNKRREVCRLNHILI